MEINVSIDEGVEVPVGEDWLRSVAEQVLTSENIISAVELGLVITTQDKVRQLNRDYRGRDEPTDVLAFSAIEEAGADFPPFVSPPDGVQHLGEVIVSYPQAAMQAEEHQHPVEQEIAILIIHGVLHLLGYEHEEPELERRMRAREAEILSSIGGN
jgi:probable rRNA maturation factor